MFYTPTQWEGTQSTKNMGEKLWHILICFKLIFFWEISSILKNIIKIFYHIV